MKKNSRRLLMFGLTSLILMTGCEESKAVEINGKTYIQKGNEYISLDMEPKVFEAGTHFINYFCESACYGHEGWNNCDLFFPEVPEGYKHVNSISIDHGAYGSTSGVLHIYVNEVAVIVEPTYNNSTGEIEYNNIGKPVKQLILE